jgi:O-antigen ligase
MIIPLSFYRIFTLKGFLRIVCIVFTLIFLAALGLTFTRGALISVPLSLILMIFFLPSRKLKIAMLSSIAGVGAIAMLAATIFDLPLFNRFLANDITTLNGRTYLWSALLNHFDPTHLLGYGLNASDVLLTQLQVGFGRGVIGTAPHNVFIGTLYDQGVIGLILIILVFIAIPWTLISRMRKANPEHRLILAMALAAFINIFVQSLEVTVMWSQPIGVYVWMIMALPFVAYWGIPKGSADRKEAHDTTMPGQTETGQRAKEEQFSHV